MKRSLGCFGGFVGFLLLFAFVGIISSCLIVFAIWPGELKLFAPIFCTDAQPDAFVVSDTTSPRPGETNTNFTLYCMGPRGDATDVGLFRPFLLASVLNGIVIMIPLMIAVVLGGIGIRRATKPPADGSGEGEGEGEGEGGRRGEDDERPERALPPPGSTAGPFGPS